jgi:hypothetical protein
MTPNFEEILLELSYRIPQGIVDLTNEQHLNELIIILEENRIPNAKQLALEAKQSLEKLLATTFKNPETGNVVKVDSALRYKKSSQAFRIASSMLDKGGYSEDDLETVDAGPDDEEKPNVFGKGKGASVFPTKSKTEPKITTPTNTNTKDGNSFKDAILSTSKQKGDDKKAAFIEKKKEAALKVIDGVGKGTGIITLLSGVGGNPVKIKTKDVQSVVSKIFDGKPISQQEANMFNSVCKMVTNPENGTVKMYFAKKMVGRHPQQGYDSIEIASDNLPMVDAIRKYSLKNGLNVGKSSEGAIGKKVLTPTKMASAVNSKSPEKFVEISSTKTGVSVDGGQLNKKQIPNESYLIKSLTPSLGKDEAIKEAKLIVRQTEAYNQRLDDLVTVGKSSGGKVSMTNFGDVKTPQTRKQTANNILDGTIKRFESELSKYAETFGKKDLLNKPENKAVFQTLSKLKEMNTKFDLEANSVHRAAYKQELDNLLINMSNSPDFVDSVADYAEMKAGLQFLAEGKRVYFPASENFQTADIIVMPDEFSIRPKKGQSLEDAIASNLQLYSVNVTYVGGLSVKYKGGGGSANYSKITQTVYNNAETQKRLLDMQDIYTLSYPKDKSKQLNISNSEIANSNNKLQDTINWAIKSGIISKQDVQLIGNIGQRQASNTLNGALKDVARCKGSNRANFEKAIVLHHTMMHLTAVINNADVKYTRFSNFNQEISQNKDGVSTKVRDDIADGVNKPCYMNPHHNPGFSTSVDEKTGCVNGTPTNQNPSHIESERPKNLLKAR